MHAEITVERNALRTKLEEANTRISHCLHKAAEDWKRINSLQTVAEQVEHLRIERQELLKQVADLTAKAHL
jgi:hypothetical protein